MDSGNARFFFFFSKLSVAPEVLSRIVNELTFCHIDAESALATATEAEDDRGTQAAHTSVVAAVQARAVEKLVAGASLSVDQLIESTVLQVAHCSR